MPVKRLVNVIAPCLATPRTDMQVCSASITTATPRGFKTSSIAAAIDEILKPRGVAVLIEAEHTCMSVRGVAKHGATTFTSRYTGMFRDNPAEQSRFLSMVRAPQR